MTGSRNMEVLLYDHINYHLSTTKNNILLLLHLPNQN